MADSGVSQTLSRRRRANHVTHPTSRLAVGEPFSAASLSAWGGNKVATEATGIHVKAKTANFTKSAARGQKAEPTTSHRNPRWIF